MALLSSNFAQQEINISASDADHSSALLADEIPPESAPTSWDHEADVVVVGGGGSGLVAAAKVLDNRRSVLVLEKEVSTGGNSQHAILAASFFTKEAKRKGLIAERSRAFRHAYAVQSNATVNPKLLQTLIDRSHEVYDWAEQQSWGKRWDAVKLAFVPDQGVVRTVVKGAMKDAPFTPATKFMAQMYPFLKWLREHVEERGGKILTGTRALTLIQDAGRVVGVKALSSDGQVLYLKAKTSVVLAGSGFSNNREMIKKHCPEVYKKAVGTFLTPVDTGEVIRMAQGVGADLAGQNTWMAFAGGIPFFDTSYTGRNEPGPWHQYLRSGWLNLARGNGWLRINSAYEEFLPDGARTDYEMHPKANVAQPGSAAYVFFDSEYPNTIWQTLPQPMLDDRPMKTDDPEDPWFQEFIRFLPKESKNWQDAVELAIEWGGIKRADTIEELALMLQLDPVRLTEAISAWNTKAAAGKPDEFGRLPQNMKPILKAPFYGLKCGALISSLSCGARVDHRFQVLDKSLQPIPGLYAAGFTAGGAAGEGVMATTALASVGYAFCSGWVAGDNASGNSSYVPDAMTFNSEIAQERFIRTLSKRLPRLSAVALKVGNFLYRMRSS